MEAWGHGEHSRLEDGWSGKKASEEEGSCWSGGKSRWLKQGPEVDPSGRPCWWLAKSLCVRACWSPISVNACQGAQCSKQAGFLSGARHGAR